MEEKSFRGINSENTSSVSFLKTSVAKNYQLILKDGKARGTQALSRHFSFVQLSW